MSYTDTLLPQLQDHIKFLKNINKEHPDNELPKGIAKLEELEKHLLTTKKVDDDIYLELSSDLMDNFIYQQGKYDGGFYFLHDVMWDDMEIADEIIKKS